ncbi:MAG: hypothetical protein JWM98_2759 [Thermoleophilia bacterium]|nr:hypothetical protein [Thermoleophilia bacterium]
MTGGGTSGVGAPARDVGGPAAVAAALRDLDRHARTIVKLALAGGALRDADLAEGVGELHARIAQSLHAISLEHGTDAMSTAAEYAATALESGLLYPGDELDRFLRDVAASARATSRDLTKGSPLG